MDLENYSSWSYLNMEPLQVFSCQTVHLPIGKSTIATTGLY